MSSHAKGVIGVTDRRLGFDAIVTDDHAEIT